MTRCLAPLVATALIAAGCGGPFLVFPGGRLSGQLVSDPVRDWSFLDTRFVELETRPEAPYSVQLNYFVREGALYLDPAPDRRWFQHLRADPQARVRFGDRIYSVRAKIVGAPGEIEGFDPDRFVVRLDWRP